MTRVDPGPKGPASAGPFGASGGRRALRAAALLLSVAVTACATASGGGGPGPGTSPGPGPEADRPADPAAAAEAALSEVRRMRESGRGAAAALLADSLYFSVRHRAGLERMAAEALGAEARALEDAGDVRAAAARLRELLRLDPDRGEAAAPRLARLRLALGDDPGAARVLRDHPGAVDDSARSLLRRAARSMSVGELETLVDGTGSGGRPDPARGLLLAELAAARARAGVDGPARSAARAALRADLRAGDRERARGVLQGRIGLRTGPVRVGLLLPGSGRFASVGDRLREGIELALERHVRSGARELELVEVDAAGTDPSEALRELEERGAVAVLGPVRSDDLARLAEGRRTPGVPVLSPTATRGVRRTGNLYTLWQRERRGVDAAAAMGRWTGRTLGGGPVGTLYPDDAQGRRMYLSFRRGLAATPAWLTAASPYRPDATTLRAPISTVSAFAPRVVFAPGGSTASVLQMAPQLSYYGVRAALVAGGPEWSDPGTLRRLDPSFSQFRVVAAFSDRTGPESGWSRFKAAYEKKYRKSLFDNILPGLGHDAMLLVARGLEGVRPARPRALARRIGRLEEVEGATGVLTPRPLTGTVHRRVRIRALEERSLAPVRAERVRKWLEGASRLETARARRRRGRALQAVRESGIELVAGEGREEGDR